MDKPTTITDWVTHCNEAAEAAAAEIMRNPPLKSGRRESESMAAFRELCEGMREPGQQTTMDVWDAKNGSPEGDSPLQGEELAQAAHKAARSAFLAALPKLTSRYTTKAYIACVGVAVQRAFVSALEGKTMLYTAQLALAAHKPRAGKKQFRG